MLEKVKKEDENILVLWSRFEEVVTASDVSWELIAHFCFLANYRGRMGEFSRWGVV